MSKNKEWGILYSPGWVCTFFVIGIILFAVLSIMSLVAVDPELGIKGLPYVWVFLAIFVEIVFWTTRVNFYDLDMYNFGPTGRTIVHKLVAVGTVIILPLLPIILYIGLNRLRYAKEER